MLTDSLRLLCGLVGALTILAAVFAYEDEAGVLRSRVLDWWVWAGDTGERATSKHAALLQRLARRLRERLDWLLGPRLVSARLLWAAAMMCGAAGFLDLAVVTVFIPRVAETATPSTLLDSTLLFTWAGSFCFLAALPAIALEFRKPRVLILWRRRRNQLWLRFDSRGLKRATKRTLFCAALAAPSWWFTQSVFYLTYKMVENGNAREVTLAVGGWSLGVTMTVVFVAAYRKVLRWCESQASLPRGIGILVASLSIALGLTAAPLALSLSVGLPPEITAALWLAAITNTINVLLSVAIFALAATITLHRFFWMALERPLAALYEILPSRKAVAALGIALVFVWQPPTTTMIQKVLQAFVGIGVPGR